MKSASAALAFFLLSATIFAATVGTFRGHILQSPDGDPSWIYVKSSNGVIRKADISSAKVTFPSDRVRRENSAKALPPGLEVRVTATQEDGEWKARTVEVLDGSPK